MELILAVIVLAIAVTVNFMSFVNLKNRIEAARKSIEYSIEIKANRTSRELQEKAQFQEMALGHLTQCAGATSNSLDRIYEKIDSSVADINKTAKHNTNEIIYRTVKGRRR